MSRKRAFYRDMQRHVAITTIGPSTLRNQGSRGVTKAAQEYLACLDLRGFHALSEGRFLRALNRETERLRQALPRGARRWGAARKALNLFLRDVCYNRFLCRASGVSSAEDWMEIPLDSLTAASLKRWTRENSDMLKLPRWPGLKGLTADISDQFQHAARKLARREGISRVHLDMRLWAVERKTAPSNS